MDTVCSPPVDVIRWFEAHVTLIVTFGTIIKAVLDVIRARVLKVEGVWTLSIAAILSCIVVTSLAMMQVTIVNSCIIGSAVLMIILIWSVAIGSDKLHGFMIDRRQVIQNGNGKTNGTNGKGTNSTD